MKYRRKKGSRVLNFAVSAGKTLDEVMYLSVPLSVCWLRLKHPQPHRQPDKVDHEAVRRALRLLIFPLERD